MSTNVIDIIVFRQKTPVGAKDRAISGAYGFAPGGEADLERSRFASSVRPRSS
jgi:hypothetical protein